MGRNKFAELTVGIFVLIAILSFSMLAIKVSGLTDVYSSERGYLVTARFTEIGGLKVRSRVTVAGVAVGRVVDIKLDPQSFDALVSLRIHSNINQLPKDTAASIVTSGLIGDNYILLDPGAESEFLKAGDMIQETHPAIILERLIGQFLFDKNK